jgi:arginase
MEPSRRRLTVLDAPSNLGLKPCPTGEPGVKHLARALRAHGLIEQLQAEDAGMVVPPPYEGAMDPILKVRNAEKIRDYSRQLANQVDRLLERGQFPIVLGGDCSILLGIALALHKRGRHGLFFVDGHTDLLTPAESETGGAAGMDLAIVTGTGPKLLTDIDGREPYLQSSHVAVFGYRWPAADDTSSATPWPPMMAFPLDLIRQQGVGEAARSVVTYLETAFEGQFWVHCDVDVLAPEWMPAVDSPDPDGMSPHELAITLTTAFESAHCIGLDITIYDPTLDPGEDGADLVVDLLVKSLQSGAV